MMKENSEKYDVLIIGAGISGASLFYVLNRFTDIPKVGIVEKNILPGQGLSSAGRNTQMLPNAGIFYGSGKKPEEAGLSAGMLKNYLGHMDPERKLHRKMQMLVIGAGGKEAKSIERRYKKLKYSGLKLLSKDEISFLEPNITKGRNRKEKLAALYVPGAYTVDYGKLAESFVSESIKKESGKAGVFLREKAKSITKAGSRYIVRTDKRFFQARTVVVSAGQYAFMEAKKSGLAGNIALLPFNYDFFLTGKLLEGNVRLLEDGPCGFSSGPDFASGSFCRFGPITGAGFLPAGPADFSEYLKIITANAKGGLLNTIKGIRAFSPNRPFCPALRRFLEKATKIIPGLTEKDVKGRVRAGLIPVVYDLRNKNLERKEVKVINDKIIFNIGSVPESSGALYGAYIDAITLIRWLREYEFKKDNFEMIFMNEEQIKKIRLKEKLSVK